VRNFSTQTTADGSLMARNVDTEESEAEPPTMLRTMENIGSTSRDVCAIERNFLAHCRLGLLLSLLSSSMLLNTRLSGRSDGRESKEFSHAQLPLAALYFASSICAILAGWWAYSKALQDFLRRKAFVNFQIHEFVIGMIAILVSSTCIYLLIMES